MELLEPLKDELAENYALVTSTDEMIRNERDMLQGDVEKRVVLLTPYDDVWKSVVNSGRISDFEEASSLVGEAYRKLNEITSIIEKFNEYGPRTMYLPFMKRSSTRYVRKNVLDVVQESCSEAAPSVLHAKEAVEKLVETECPVCSKRFESRTGLKSHITQKNDPEHKAIRDKVV